VHLAHVSLAAMLLVPCAKHTGAAAGAQVFSGRWVVEPDPTVQNGLELAAVLRYELSLLPRWPLPAALVTHVVQAGLPANIRAVARRAEQARRGCRSPTLSACCSIMYVVW
jgi:hypothetical protein